MSNQSSVKKKNRFAEVSENVTCAVFIASFVLTGLLFIAKHTAFKHLNTNYHDTSECLSYSAIVLYFVITYLRYKFNE